MAKEYTAALIDGEGNDIARDNWLTSLAEAKRRARRFMSHDWAVDQGTLHSILGSYKVEVRDAGGVCLWDAFL
jgi:DNA-binding IclR family transcriptional regulator